MVGARDRETEMRLNRVDSSANRDCAGVMQISLPDSEGAIIIKKNKSNKCDNKTPSSKSSLLKYSNRDSLVLLISSKTTISNGLRRSGKLLTTCLAQMIAINYHEQKHNVHHNATWARRLIVIICLTLLLNLQYIASSSTNNQNNLPYTTLYNDHQFHYHFHHNHPKQNNWHPQHHPQNCPHPSHHVPNKLPVSPETITYWNNQYGYHQNNYRFPNRNQNQIQIHQHQPQPQPQPQYQSPLRDDYLNQPKLVHLRSPTNQQPTNLVIRENQLNLLNNQQLIQFRQQNQFQQQKQLQNNEKSVVNRNEFFVDHQLPTRPSTVKPASFAKPLTITTTTTTTRTKTETETNEQQFNKQRFNIQRQSGATLDIDECLDENVCGRGASCENLPGSFSCSCPPGFTGDPTKECIGK